MKQYSDWYTLAADGWAVTFGTARRGLRHSVYWLKSIAVAAVNVTRRPTDLSEL